MHVFSTIGWTTDQWIMFGCFTVAGLGGLGLIGMWISGTRARRTEHADVARLIAGWRATPSMTLALVTGTPATPLTPRALIGHVDPTGELFEHLAPGAGSLTTLAAVGEGSLTRAAPTVDADVAAWFAEAFDRPAHAPGRAEAGVLDEGGVFTRFHAALEPAMRKARLWELQGASLEHGGSASHWATLAHWRIESPTGEYALIDHPDHHRAVAEALLVAV